MNRRGFTLVEILAVVLILALLAAILLPVFSRAKEAAKASACASSLRQIGLASSLYLADSDGRYPQTKRTSANPEIDDVSGGSEEPEFGTFFSLIRPYLKDRRVLTCPSDQDPQALQCAEASPDAEDVNSYVANASFVFGLAESQVGSPATTILLGERREAGGAPYCDTLYRPWWSRGNPLAPEVDMDGVLGAFAASRHGGRANWGFADSHVRSLAWSQTYAPGQTDLHSLIQP